MSTVTGTVLVIKVGGALLQCEMGMARLMETVYQMLRRGQAIVIVHGGGYMVEAQLQANQMQTQKIDGLRVTPTEQMPVVVGALAGMANKTLQAAAKKAGINSVGLSLADADMVTATFKNDHLGHVGQVSPLNSQFITLLLANRLMPIISSIAIDNDGNLLNVNADQAATAIAQLVAGQLILLSDVSGVLDGKGQLIEQLNQTQIAELVKQGVIDSGMKVKVEAALEVAQTLGEPVQVASWRDAKQLAELAKGLPVGTQIHP